MKDKGELTASLGVSNFRPQDFNELLPHCKVKPAVNQIGESAKALSALALTF